MVEVFATNVMARSEADLLVERIEACFSSCKVNFDLGDCDRILRIQSAAGNVDSEKVIDFLKSFGYHISVLPDIVVPIKEKPMIHGIKYPSLAG